MKARSAFFEVMEILTATAAFAATNGERTSLMVFTLDGQEFEFTLTDPRMLLESLTRAVKVEESQEIKDALLVKPQPKSVRVGRFEV